MSILNHLPIKLRTPINPFFVQWNPVAVVNAYHVIFFELNSIIYAQYLNKDSTLPTSVEEEHVK